MQNMLVTKAVKSFKCLQDACSDTCCKGWSMQLDDATFAKYEANNLQNAVAFDGDVRVMKRDPKTDFCVKFQDGICSIHKNMGNEFLGDACNFYPRVTRKLGDEAIMTLTPSCPEALRLMLEEGADIYEESELERLPANLKNWADEKISAGDALKIHQRFLAECKEQISPEKLVSRVFSVASSLNYIEKQDWADATNFMFKMADGKLPTPATQDIDKYNILQVFLGVLHATGKNRSERLQKVLDSLADFLGITINYQTLNLEQNFSKPTPAILPQNDVLKQYVAAQISFSCFPFAGIGDDLRQKAQVLIFKFALTKLALKNWQGNAVDCIQPISRIIDHIADAELIVKLMNNSAIA